MVAYLWISQNWEIEIDKLFMYWHPLLCRSSLEPHGMIPRACIDSVSKRHQFFILLECLCCNLRTVVSVVALVDVGWKPMILLKKTNCLSIKKIWPECPHVSSWSEQLIAAFIERTRVVLTVLESLYESRGRWDPGVLPYHLTWTVNDRPTYLPLQFSAATSSTHPKNACLEIRTRTQIHIEAHSHYHLFNSWSMSICITYLLWGCRYQFIEQEKMPTENSFRKQSRWAIARLKSH